MKHKQEYLHKGTLVQHPFGQWIRRYFEIGWAVLPLRLTRDPATGKKVPDFGGFGWKDGPHTLAESLRRLAALGQQANALALLTGRASGVTVIDGDGAQGVANAARHIPQGTPTARTQSDGRHFFFAYTPDLPTSANRALRVDVRNDGGYIFLPPSRVAGGGSYTWITAPDHALAPVPPSLVALLRPANAPNESILLACARGP
jgi:hypothetical protein